ncbi:MAG: PAS domain-containing protein, partial [Alphaproteobacteria bacterium]|nr:PAS domain-containing protein [Alphaproteobacteria bacterium]
MIADLKQPVESPAASVIANALPMPVIVVGPQQQIVFVNPAAEQFFDMGAGLLLKQKLTDLIPFGSPLLQLIGQAVERRASVGERDVDLSTPRHGERIADLIVTPLPGPDGAAIVMLQERSLAQRIDRQLLHRGAVR